jgi:hypothetical protein
MDKPNGSLDQSAPVREHVRAILQKLNALHRANRQAGRNRAGSAQEHIKADREERSS